MEVGSGFAAWTQWPLKKSNVNTILRVNRVKAYDDVITQLQAGRNPGAETVWNAFKAWAEAQRFDNCIVAHDYVDALLKRPFDLSARPYAEGATIDSPIFAAHYDHGAYGHAYYDTGDASYQYNGETLPTGTTAIYRNDGVGIEIDIVFRNHIMRLQRGLDRRRRNGSNLPSKNPYGDAKWDLELRYANSGKVSVTVDGREVAPSTQLASTGGYQTWKTHTFEGVIIPQGTIKVRLHIDRGGCNLNYLRFVNRREASAAELATLVAPAGAKPAQSSDCTHSDFWLHADFRLASFHAPAMERHRQPAHVGLGRRAQSIVETLRLQTSWCIRRSTQWQGTPTNATWPIAEPPQTKTSGCSASFFENEPVHYADLYMAEDRQSASSTRGQIHPWAISTATCRQRPRPAKIIPTAS